jgi:hypothetical protein
LFHGRMDQCTQAMLRAVWLLAAPPPPSDK